MFEPEPGLMIWTVVSFALLLGLLKKFAYKPVLELMEGREKAIQATINESEQKRQAAEDLLLQYQQQLNEGREEVQKMIEEGRTAGENLKTEILEKTSEEAKGLIKKAHEEIEREKKKALMELQERVADISVGVATKIITQTLEPKDHEKLIEEALAQVKADYAKSQ
ncbi:MAG: F0F1 ATP synthase subunit B [Nitrospiria bacterium]